MGKEYFIWENEFLKLPHNSIILIIEFQGNTFWRRQEKNKEIFQEGIQLHKTNQRPVRNKITLGNSGIACYLRSEVSIGTFEMCHHSPLKCFGQISSSVQLIWIEQHSVELNGFIAVCVLRSHFHETLFQMMARGGWRRTMYQWKNIKNPSISFKERT